MMKMNLAVAAAAVVVATAPLLVVEQPRTVGKSPVGPS